MEHAYEIWNALVKKYVFEDAGTKKYAVGNFLDFQMVDEKEVSSQIHEFHLASLELKNEGMVLPETFIAAALIHKLPQSWRDYKNAMKHKRKDMTLEEVIVHIRIEEKNKQLVRNQKAKEITAKANVIQDKPRKGGSFKPKAKHASTHLKPQGSTFKKKGNCFVCGKPGHHAHECRHRKINEKPAKPWVNLAEADDVIAAVVISEANMVASEKDWVVDSGATRHICGNRSAFTSYTPVGEGEEQVFMGNSKPSPVIGKGKVMLKLTSGKVLSLSDVLHVPEIRSNLVSVSLLSKAGVKISFESDKLVMTRNNVFVGKGYCNKGLFVINVSEVMNNNASSSAYIVDSIDL